MSAPVTISHERRMLGLEAVWEIEALTDVVRAISAGNVQDEMDITDLMRASLQFRGVTARIRQLSGVVISVLDDDDKTRDLERKVFGEQPPDTSGSR